LEEVGQLLHAHFLLGLFFDPANGADMFLQNVGCLSTDYIVISQKIELYNDNVSFLVYLMMLYQIQA
jgi:hypothetical protein